MGCIEINLVASVKLDGLRLTLTWDVLKCVLYIYCPSVFWINFNMGCIEIFLVLSRIYTAVQINFNMGCIEISEVLHFPCFVLLINFNMGCIEIEQLFRQTYNRIRLTLTWDVLKFFNRFNMKLFEPD